MRCDGGASSTDYNAIQDRDELKVMAHWASLNELTQVVSGTRRRIGPLMPAEKRVSRASRTVIFFAAFVAANSPKQVMPPRNVPALSNKVMLRRAQSLGVLQFVDTINLIR